MDIRFIDIFAGPGGLGEGFSRYGTYSNNRIKYKGVLSIEKDKVAADTLTLRNWVHQYDDRDLPNYYYEALKDPEVFTKIHSTPEWQRAKEVVWNAELGKVCEKELHERLQKAIGGKEKWVLLGGPPCQAYSLVGRSRLTGMGMDAEKLNPKEATKARKDREDRFYNDRRHILYLEYLRIVAIHQPSVFVMENVKGILSSKIPTTDGSQERIFPKIRADLANPGKALVNDKVFNQLKQFHPTSHKTYKLYSFVCPFLGKEPADQEFIIRCENYGVPQSRHRVIILGIREDIEVASGILEQSRKINVRNILNNMPKLRSGLSKGGDSSISWLATIRECFSENTIQQLESLGVGGQLHKLLDRTQTSYTRGASFITSKKRPKHSPFPVMDWIQRHSPDGTIQHETRGHMGSDLGRYMFASLMAQKNTVTPKLQDWPIELLPKHRNISVNEETGIVSVSGFHDRFRVQAWDKPSTTITSHISKDGHYYIHPDPAQCRSLTVREAARLQTFPDNYYFCGNRTQQYHQVGNAVPPYLAVQLADIVAVGFHFPECYTGLAKAP